MRRKTQVKESLDRPVRAPTYKLVDSTLAIFLTRRDELARSSFTEDKNWKLANLNDTVEDLMKDSLENGALYEC
jgi:hypothetical protein